MYDCNMCIRVCMCVCVCVYHFSCRLWINRRRICWIHIYIYIYICVCMCMYVFDVKRYRFCIQVFRFDDRSRLYSSNELSRIVLSRNGWKKEKLSKRNQKKMQATGRCKESKIENGCLVGEKGRWFSLARGRRAYRGRTQRASPSPRVTIERDTPFCSICS